MLRHLVDIFMFLGSWRCVSGLHNQALLGALAYTGATLYTAKTINSPGTTRLIHRNGSAGTPLRANTTQDTVVNIVNHMSL